MRPRLPFRGQYARSRLVLLETFRTLWRSTPRCDRARAGATDWRSPLRRVSSLVFAMLVITSCQDMTEPFAPSMPSLSVAALNGEDGLGVLLATTDAGELVRIDIDAGTADLLGDVGAVGGRNPGWSGISFDPNGDLFVTSAQFSENNNDCVDEFGTPSKSCAHLYQIDPFNGALIAEIRNNTDIHTGITFLSDIDFMDATLLANFHVLVVSTDHGALATIYPSSGPKATLVGTALGDPDFGRALENGGLSVHPVTGDVWAVESNSSLAAEVTVNKGPHIFRVDPATGLAGLALGPPVRLGLGGSPTTFGLDALEILCDGRFVGTRAGGSSTLYLIDPEPDPSTGLANLTLIPISDFPSLGGELNGLESGLTPLQVVCRIVAENPGTPMADKLEGVIANVGTAFAERSKTPPDNQAALGKIEGAVGDLEAAVNDDLLDSDLGAQLMNELAVFARQIAVNALNEAMAGDPDPDVIADAQQYLVDGDVLRALGAFKDAVNKYKDALAKAESA